MYDVETLGVFGSSLPIREELDQKRSHRCRLFLSSHGLVELSRAIVLGQWTAFLKKKKEGVRDKVCISDPTFLFPTSALVVWHASLSEGH